MRGHRDNKQHSQDLNLGLPNYKTHVSTPFVSLCQVPSAMSDSFAISWTVAQQAPLPMGFSRQECWSGLLCLSPGDLPNLGIEPESLKSSALAGRFFTTSTTGKPFYSFNIPYICCTTAFIIILYSFSLICFLVFIQKCNAKCISVLFVHFPLMIILMKHFCS